MASYSHEMTNSRAVTLEAMERSVPASIWHYNGEMINALQKDIERHPLLTHSILEELRSGKYNLQNLQAMHLDYRYSIVQSFTDALLMAQFQSRQIEVDLTPGSKMLPRFLLTLNVLDEFGFEPGVSPNGGYKGHPLNAHYSLFEKVLDDMSVTISCRRTFTPSEPAKRLRQSLEDSYSNYIDIITLLAVAEQQVITYSPALRAAVGCCGVDVKRGYYYVHGTSLSAETEASDDDHQEDLWMVLRQACTSQDFERVRRTATNYLDLWVSFWDHQSSLKFSKSSLSVLA